MAHHTEAFTVVEALDTYGIMQLVSDVYNGWFFGNYSQGGFAVLATSTLRLAVVHGWESFGFELFYYLTEIHVILLSGRKAFEKYN